MAPFNPSSPSFRAGPKTTPERNSKGEDARGRAPGGGHAERGSPAAPQEGCPAPRASAAWYYRPVWIVVLTLAVLGPFSLPLVWLSPCMSRREKIVLALGIAAFSVFMCVVLWKTIVLLIGLYRDLSDIMKQANA